MQMQLMETTPPRTNIRLVLKHSICIRTVRPYLLFSIGEFNSFLAGLHKRPINHFKPFQQSRQKALKASCSNIYIPTLE